MRTYCSSKNFPFAPGFLLLNMASAVENTLMAFISTSSFAVKQLHELTSTFTLAIPCLVEFGQHFIHEVCSVRFWVWYLAIFGLLPRTCVFNAWPLKFNTPKTQCLTTCRGNCCCVGFFFACITFLWSCC